MICVLLSDVIAQEFSVWICVIRSVAVLRPAHPWVRAFVYGDRCIAIVVIIGEGDALVDAVARLRVDAERCVVRLCGVVKEGRFFAYLTALLLCRRLAPDVAEVLRRGIPSVVVR